MVVYTYTYKSLKSNITFGFYNMYIIDALILICKNNTIKINAVHVFVDREHFAYFKYLFIFLFNVFYSQHLPSSQLFTQLCVKYNPKKYIISTIMRKESHSDTILLIGGATWSSCHLYSVQPVTQQMKQWTWTLSLSVHLCYLTFLLSPAPQLLAIQYTQDAMGCIDKVKSSYKVSQICNITFLENPSLPWVPRRISTCARLRPPARPAGLWLLVTPCLLTEGFVAVAARVHFESAVVLRRVSGKMRCLNNIPSCRHQLFLPRRPSTGQTGRREAGMTTQIQNQSPGPRLQLSVSLTHVEGLWPFLVEQL